MYMKHFGLKRDPFSIAPDPHFLFMSERHREALAHLLYGLDGGGGFVLLTGEVGAGKTTVCRCFLEQIPKRCNVAYIFNPKLTVEELLRSVCEEFHIPVAPPRDGAGTVKHYLDPLNDFLLRAHAVGQNNVLIIDEAQNLSAEVLEQLRLLTNLETSERKLLQIILIGQPELRELLSRPELEQLSTRVIARFHLGALSEAETSQYIKHRLAVAGAKGVPPFDREARRLIHKLSRGIPRRINLLCDRAMLGAYSADKARVDRAIVEKAAREVFFRNEGRSAEDTSRRRPLAWALAALAGAVAIGIVAWRLGEEPAGIVVEKAAAGVASTTAVAATAAAPAAPNTPPPASAPAAPSAGASSAPTAAASGSVAKPAQAPAPRAASPLPTLIELDTADELTVRFDDVLRDADQAWRELAAFWKLSLGTAGDPCARAARTGLACHKTSNTLALLRQLARPAVLTLVDDKGRPAYVLLTGLTEQSAILRAGGVAQTVSLVALSRTWRGEFATLWRTPPGWRGPIAPGQSGEAVDWLAAQLAKVQGQSAPATRRRFDDDMKSRIFAFQFSQEIRPDGLPGPETLMLLNRAAGIDEPRLQSEE